MSLETQYDNTEMLQEKFTGLPNDEDTDPEVAVKEATDNTEGGPSGGKRSAKEVREEANKKMTEVNLLVFDKVTSEQIKEAEKKIKKMPDSAPEKAIAQAYVEKGFIAPVALHLAETQVKINKLPLKWKSMADRFSADGELPNTIREKIQSEEQRIISLVDSTEGMGQGVDAEIVQEYTNRGYSEDYATAQGKVSLYLTRLTDGDEKKIVGDYKKQKLEPTTLLQEILSYREIKKENPDYIFVFDSKKSLAASVEKTNFDKAVNDLISDFKKKDISTLSPERQSLLKMIRDDFSPQATIKPEEIDKYIKDGMSLMKDAGSMWKERKASESIALLDNVHKNEAIDYINQGKTPEQAMTMVIQMTVLNCIDPKILGKAKKEAQKLGVDEKLLLPLINTSRGTIDLKLKEQQESQKDMACHLIDKEILKNYPNELSKYKIQKKSTMIDALKNTGEFSNLKVPLADDEVRHIYTLAALKPASVRSSFEDNILASGEFAARTFVYIK